MKIQLLSDLHNEFYPGHKAPPISPTDADVVVLAGDIDLGVGGVHWAAEQAERLGKEIIYVAGNHEFYDHDIALRERLRETAAGLEHVHFLDNDELLLGDIRFLGCTLWTDYRAAGNQPMAMFEVKRYLNDHRVIRNGPRRFLPEDALQLHEQSRAWLAHKLGEPFAGKTVVITHHGPHPVCQHPDFALDLFGTAFWSDLSDLVGRADLWCFGHTHSNVDTYHGKCRIIANQRGYPDENVSSYRADLVIDVGR